MKRYDMDNTGCDYEDPCGNWVDADIAQELYDALCEAYLWGNLPMPMKGRIEKVIAKTDGK